MSDKDKHVAAMLRMRDDALQAWGRNTVVVTIETELERLGFDAEGKPLKRDAPPAGRKDAPPRRTVVHQP